MVLMMMEARLPMNGTDDNGDGVSQTTDDGC